jgi:hypothetical protein
MSKVEEYPQQAVSHGNPSVGQTQDVAETLLLPLGKRHEKVQGCMSIQRASENNPCCGSL